MYVSIGAGVPYLRLSYKKYPFVVSRVSLRFVVLARSLVTPLLAAGRGGARKFLSPERRTF